jgi:hypothetical protein
MSYAVYLSCVKKLTNFKTFFIFLTCVSNIDKTQLIGSICQSNSTNLVYVMSAQACP